MFEYYEEELNKAIFMWEEIVEKHRISMSLDLGVEISRQEAEELVINSFVRHEEALNERDAKR